MRLLILLLLLPVMVFAQAVFADREVSEYFRKALNYQNSGDYDNAIIAYREVIKLNNNLVSAHNNLGIVYSLYGFFSDAEKTIVQARDTKELLDLGIDILEGINLLTSGDKSASKTAVHPKFKMSAKKGYREAIREFQTVISIDPSCGMAYYNLALISHITGKFGAALENYKTALNFYPDDPNLYYHIACATSMLGQEDKAIDFLEKAIDKGLNNYSSLSVNNELDRLKDNPRFNNLILRMQKITLHNTGNNI